MIFRQHNLWFRLATAQAAIAVLCFQGLPFRKCVRTGDLFSSRLAALVECLYFFRISPIPTPSCFKRSFSPFICCALFAHRFAGSFAGPIQVFRTALAHPLGLTLLNLWALFICSFHCFFVGSGTRCASVPTLGQLIEGQQIPAIRTWMQWNRALLILLSTVVVSACAAAWGCAVVITRPATQGARGCYTVHVSLQSRLADPRLLQAARGFPIFIIPRMAL